MIQIFGNFNDKILNDQPSLRLVFPIRSFVNQWQNVGLSASFLANFCESLFRGAEPAYTAYSPEEIESSVSYIANELIENAVKYNADQSMEIALSVYLKHDRLTIVVLNSIANREVPRLQGLIRDITVGDVGELLIQRMEESFLGGSASGLGLLTIMHDHEAQLGWRFETLAGKPGVKWLTTAASLSLVKSRELVA